MPGHITTVSFREFLVKSNIDIVVSGEKSKPFLQRYESSVSLDHALVREANPPHPCFIYKSHSTSPSLSCREPREVRENHIRDFESRCPRWRKQVIYCLTVPSLFLSIFLSIWFYLYSQ